MASQGTVLRTKGMGITASYHRIRVRIRTTISTLDTL
jgi:hypothetical protein